LTQAPARTTDSAPTTLPSQTIAAGSTTLPRPMRQPWIIAPGPITASSSMISSLSGSADDRGAVAENGSLTHPDGMLGGADHHPVLQDGGVIADAHRRAVRPHHQALGQDHARTDVDLPQHHRRTGNLRPGLVGEKLVEAHAASPSFWPSMFPAPHVLRMRPPGRARIRQWPVTAAKTGHWQM
jgi:hypothetical protein